MRFRFIIVTFTSGFIYPTFTSWMFKEGCSIHYKGIENKRYEQKRNS